MQKTPVNRPFAGWGCPFVGGLVLLILVVLVGHILWSIAAERGRRVAFEIPVHLVPEGEDNAVHIRCIVPENEYVCYLHVADVPNPLPEDYHGATAEFGYRVTNQKGVLCEGKAAIDLSPDELRSRRVRYRVIPLFAASGPETHLHVRIDLPPATDVPVFLHKLSLRFMSYSDFYKQDVHEEI